MLLKSTSPQGFQTEFQAKIKNGALDFEFRVIGPINELEIPKFSAESSFKDRLWTGTCFEIFLKRADLDSYQEWNFSPSGDWAFYHFVKYRTPSQNVVNFPTLGSADLQASAVSLIYKNQIPLQEADSFHPCVILKKKDGSLLFWASEIQNSKPDFHLSSLYRKLDELI